MSTVNTSGSTAFLETFLRESNFRAHATGDGPALSSEEAVSSRPRRVAPPVPRLLTALRRAAAIPHCRLGGPRTTLAIAVFIPAKRRESLE
jgi:hypothetical protein